MGNKTPSRFLIKTRLHMPTHTHTHTQLQNPLQQFGKM